jgi:hypothetical protein
MIFFSLAYVESLWIVGEISSFSKWNWQKPHQIKASNNYNKSQIKIEQTLTLRRILITLNNCKFGFKSSYFYFYLKNH